MSTRLHTTPALAALFALTALSPGMAGAACPLVEKIVAGTVVGAGGKGLPGIAVTATWSEKQASQVTSRALSDQNGRFELVIQYSTYSGRSFGGADRCEGPAPSAEIQAALPDGKPVRERVDLGTEYGEVKLVLAG
jgi:hypothetical protein